MGLKIMIYIVMVFLKEQFRLDVSPAQFLIPC